MGVRGHPEEPPTGPREGEEPPSCFDDARFLLRLADTLAALRDALDIEVAAAPFRLEAARDPQLSAEVAARVGKALDRARDEAALRDSEHKFRSLFNAMDEGYLISDVEFDADGSPCDVHYIEANPAATRMFGLDRTGRRATEIGDFERYWYDIWAEVARTGVSQRLERHSRTTGLWYDFYVFKPEPLNTESRRVAAVFQDATERRRAEMTLRESEERFRQFAEASSDVLWIRDAATLGLEFVSRAFQDIYSAPLESVTGPGDLPRWLALVAPDDRDGVSAHLERALAGEASTHVFRILRRSDGLFRWIQDTAFPLRDGEGRVERIAGITADITESRQSAEHQATLLAELQHRVRNILAIIHSIAVRTGHGARSVEAYAELMVGRLMALARTQALLTRSANAGVEVGLLVRDEVEAQAEHPDQYRIDGPEVVVPPKAAEVLTLAIHELTTNALKYGALSEPGGRLTVTWSDFERDGAPWLGLDWIEQRATPEPETGVRRRGFGTELIERRVPHELRGSGRLSLGPSGARCRLEFPLIAGASILSTDAPSLARVHGGAGDMAGEATLTGCRVMVVEDDFLLASDTEQALRTVGAQVTGPFSTLRAAMAALEATIPDAAVIDINLGGEWTLDLAEAVGSTGDRNTLTFLRRWSVGDEAAAADLLFGGPAG
ncbi:MAG: PAS domain S-box protein [Caulobacter sp.]|nr:PAS domain S-box protein [Caulobacter sp.]